MLKRIRQEIPPGRHLVFMVLLAVVLMIGCDAENNEWDKLSSPTVENQLALTKNVELVAGDSAHEGAELRYIIGVRNIGSLLAENVTVMDSMPSEVTLVGVLGDRGIFDVASGIWDVGDIAPDSSAQLMLTVTINEGTLGNEVVNVAVLGESRSSSDDLQARVSFRVVNDPPSAGPDAYALDEGDSLEVPMPGLLGNDHDSADEILTVDPVPVLEPLHGTLVLAENGSFTYRHDGSEAPADTFAYLVVDASAEVDTGRVVVTVVPVNDAPVAVPATFEVLEGGGLVGNVLATDSDVDSDTLVAFLVTAPVHADDFSLTEDGSFSYTHDSSEGSEDSFVYVAFDGETVSELTTITIELRGANDTPAILEISDQTVAEGDAFAVLELDQLVDDPDHAGDEISWLVSGTIHLQADYNADQRTISIAPLDPEWSGSEMLTFRATDPGQAWDEETAVFTITPVNDAPNIMEFTVPAIDEGNTFALIDLATMVHDPDHPDEVLEWRLSGAVDLDVRIENRHDLLVTQPHADWFGSESIRLVALDPEGLEGVADVEFTIDPVNDTPVVSPLPNQTSNVGGAFLPIALDGFVNDVDNEDQEMTWTYSGQGEFEVTIDENRVAWVAAPYFGWTGEATITFRATDPGGLWSQRTSHFEVLP